MPAYEYECGTCKRAFIITMPFSLYGISSVRCAHCGSDKIMRKYTSKQTTVIFKGHGYYSKDKDR